MSELTVLLAAARRGDERAAGQAFTLLYEDLRRLARALASAPDDDPARYDLARA